jgi:hypothetical protein
MREDLFAGESLVCGHQQPLDEVLHLVACGLQGGHCMGVGLPLRE